MIELKHLSKTFETAGGRVDALKDVSLTIPDGDVYGIIGMSGAGKSTLVRCINMLERPTEGEVIVNGQRLDTMTPAQLRAARREITMIFQRFNLLMQRNCLANVCFPMELSGLRGEKKWREQRALELLEIVGLKDKAKAYPAQLSGGQQQRVAIARALATNPKVLLCDEATSALDPKTTRQILELIGDINKKLGITVVIITHQMSVVKEVCNHVAILDDGEVVEEGLPIPRDVRHTTVRSMERFHIRIPSVRDNCPRHRGHLQTLLSSCKSGTPFSCPSSLLLSRRLRKGHPEKRFLLVLSQSIPLPMRICVKAKIGRSGNKSRHGVCITDEYQNRPLIRRQPFLHAHPLVRQGEGGYLRKFAN